MSSFYEASEVVQQTSKWQYTLYAKNSVIVFIVALLATMNYISFTGWGIVAIVVIL